MNWCKSAVFVCAIITTFRLRWLPHCCDTHTAGQNQPHIHSSNGHVCVMHDRRLHMYVLVECGREYTQHIITSWLASGKPKQAHKHEHVHTHTQTLTCIMQQVCNSIVSLLDHIIIHILVWRSCPVDKDVCAFRTLRMALRVLTSIRCSVDVEHSALIVARQFCPSQITANRRVGVFQLNAFVSTNYTRRSMCAIMIRLHACNVPATSQLEHPTVVVQKNTTHVRNMIIK